MMFGGYETIEAYEDDLYREESSSELSVDSEVEFQLYSQIHYAQDLGNVIREEEHEEKNSGISKSLTSKPSQKNLIVLSDSEVIQLSDGSEVITLSDEDSIYRCARKNIRDQAQEKTRSPPASLLCNELADKKCKRDIETPKPEERTGVIREVMIIEVSSGEEESTVSESDNVESWMLLGCEADDRDDGILLNLVGCENSVTEGEDGVNWFINDKDIEACPEIWRQYHLTTKPGPPKKPKTPSGQSALVYCYNCAQKGHYGHECTEERMFHEPFPTSPFIYYYDDKYEIQEREQRIKRKVKELQKNGNFPRQFKRSQMEAEGKRPHHDVKKSHASWKSNRWPQENRESQKDMVNRNREREKQRKANRHREVDEDFPRGSKSHSSSSSFKTLKPHKSFHHSSHYHKPREDKLPKESKRGKQKKKEKYLEDDSNDNLFLIKQRKKKSKL
ncbi:zinc finger CCHC domain-containing protein 7 isoform X2 [Cynocephalus volans]|uniref:zinc finger CCHC domain-containing protein 7 isoform X2 n=1 Tax=Cynocephalus volans TaxID=110931 RepID=UPI002FCBA5ED